jgi:hypothetical protein
MKASDYLLLLIIGGIAILVVSGFQSSPGYMDSEYYYGGGMRLAQGYGFTEVILWNYLDDPVGLPHPSHTYWMPLASLLAGGGMKLFGEKFIAAKIGFVLIAVCVPLLTAWFSFTLTRQRLLSNLSGLLAIFSGFYLPNFPTTDTFGICMILGTLVLFSIQKWETTYRNWSWRSILTFCLFGILTGVMHLTRADGILWILLGLMWIVLNWLKLKDHHNSTWYIIPYSAVMIVAYLVIMGAWYLRNYLSYGSIFPAGSSHALWLLDYNELFSYPGTLLTSQRWIQSGLESIIKIRLWAIGQNALSALVVQGSIVLSPFIILGLWKYRKDSRVQFGVLAWLSSYLLMSLIFPFVGVRGGFFHSSAALQPLFWSMAPVGMISFIDLMGHLRKWNIKRTRIVFSVGLIVIATFVTILIFNNRVLGHESTQPVWGEDYQRYTDMESALLDYGAGSEQIVMVNNAPGYYSCNGRPSISIPNGDLNTVLSVAERYHAKYLLLEFDQLLGQSDLYTAPSDKPGLKYLGGVGSTRVYQFDSKE